MPSESWSMRIRVEPHSGHHHYTVIRDKPGVGKMDIGGIRQEWGARETVWVWNLYRLHAFGILAGRCKDLEDGKRQLRAAFDEQVAIRGPRIVDEALVPKHMRGEDWPWPKD